MVEGLAAVEFDRRFSSDEGRCSRTEERMSTE
jgi:hypothetical protein